MTRALTDASTLFRREWLRYRRDRVYWAGQIGFPLLVIGFIGFGLDRVVVLPTETTYVAHLASGIVALVIASGAVGGGFTLIEDRESGFLRALLVAPVSRTSIVLGKVAARITMSLALVAVLVALLSTFTPVGLPHPGAAVLAVTGLTTTFVALGVVLASTLRSAESFRFLAAVVTVPLYLLSGIFYPVTTLPLPTRVLAQLNPLSYGVDLLRHGLVGVHELPVAASAILLTLLTALCLAVAVAVFDRRQRA